MKNLHPTFSRLATSLFAAALLAVVATSSGCVAVVAGVGAGAAVAYVRGDLDVTLAASYGKSARAVEETLADLKYARISNKQDALQAVFVSRNAADQKIEVYLEKLSDDATKLKIRVGTFGQESIQNEILQRIRANL